MNAIALSPKVPDTIETVEVVASPEQIISPAVELTEGARKQIKRVLVRKQLTMPGAFLRIGVRGGGCSGLSYQLEPDTEFDDRDLTWVTVDGIRVVVDQKSLTFLNGMSIDYDIKNLLEGGWVYKNPNAARSCGCGTSFTPVS
jgi:iron-sulfur cluster assembly protein